MLPPPAFPLHDGQSQHLEGGGEMGGMIRTWEFLTVARFMLRSDCCDIKFEHKDSGIFHNHRGPSKTASLGPLTSYVDIKNKFQDCFDAFTEFQDHFGHRR
jgi:hypothetical protein